ncbi:MAG: 16S rRNA (cytosine(1402)-N(4))-methyltransferase RsmH [Candidatus Latescibacteria bacterium]|jgi:16S rRNA (cytosine1402-N4)-methyltransferase|nr:16S rRNA (cytosine(1402)-N(4))-methyltransferase RsmH [Candidatus Latescibacterota bacterium]
MAEGDSEFHIPVLGLETAEWLLWNPLGTYVDGTVGGGGHAEHLLDRLEEVGKLVGIDRDPDAVAEATSRLRKFGPRVILLQGSFRRMSQMLAEVEISKVDGILMDLGVSSHQIDRAERGFSYRHDGPLDMRMGPDSARSAREVVNGYSQADLTRVLKEFGEDRAAGRIARAICRSREQGPIERTSELADLVARAIGSSRTTKSLARVYQAIRIEVNDELACLEEALPAAVDLLKPSGRVAILTYHSLEDRVVKRSFRQSERGCICPPDLPVCGCGRLPKLKVLTPRGVRATDEEVARNPRSRSATLRVGERLAEMEKDRAAGKHL